jgi:hypothetical protein
MRSGQPLPWAASAASRSERPRPVRVGEQRARALDELVRRLRADERALERGLGGPDHRQLRRAVAQRDDGQRGGGRVQQRRPARGRPRVEVDVGGGEVRADVGDRAEDLRAAARRRGELGPRPVGLRSDDERAGLGVAVEHRAEEIGHRRLEHGPHLVVGGDGQHDPVLRPQAERGAGGVAVRERARRGGDREHERALGVDAAPLDGVAGVGRPDRRHDVGAADADPEGVVAVVEEDDRRAPLRGGEGERGDDVLRADVEHDEVVLGGERPQGARPAEQVAPGHPDQAAAARLDGRGHDAGQRGDLREQQHRRHAPGVALHPAQRGARVAADRVGLREDVQDPLGAGTAGRRAPARDVLAAEPVQQRLELGAREQAGRVRHRVLAGDEGPGGGRERVALGPGAQGAALEHAEAHFVAGDRAPRGGQRGAVGRGLQEGERHRSPGLIGPASGRLERAQARTARADDRGACPLAASC